MANRSKAKGYRGEVEVMTMLQTVVNQEYAAVGMMAPELTRSPAGRDIRGLPWIAVEVKYREQTSGINSWWEQTKKNSNEVQAPVLIWRSNYEPWRVRMFGALLLADGRKVKCPVDITQDAFLTWFRYRVKENLAQRS